jgi:vacuolar-type H+-ATPase subunit H
LFKYYTNQIDIQEGKRDKGFKEVVSKYEKTQQESEEIRDKAIREANAKYEEILKRAEEKRDKLIKEANAKCEEVIKRAEEKKDEEKTELNSRCDRIIRDNSSSISSLNTEDRPPEPAHIIRTRSELAEVESIIHFRTKFFERLANAKDLPPTILPAKTWTPSPELLEKEKELAELRRLARLGLLDEN